MLRTPCFASDFVLCFGVVLCFDDVVLCFARRRTSCCASKTRSAFRSRSGLLCVTPCFAPSREVAIDVLALVTVRATLAYLVEDQDGQRDASLACAYRAYCDCERLRATNRPTHLGYVGALNTHTRAPTGARPPKARCRWLAPARLLLEPVNGLGRRHLPPPRPGHGTADWFAVPLQVFYAPRSQRCF